MKHLLIRNRRPIIAAGALLFTGVLCWLSVQEPQPVYGGKRILSYFPNWIFRTGPQPAPITTFGGRAVVPIMMPQSPELPLGGPEIIPWLLRILRKEDSAFMRLSLRYSPRLPVPLQRLLPAPIPASRHWEMATEALMNVASRYPKAVGPSLVLVLEKGTPAERAAAARALMSLGPEAAPGRHGLTSTVSYDVHTSQNLTFEGLLWKTDIDEPTMSAMTAFWSKQRGIDGPELSNLAVSYCRAMSSHGPRASTSMPALALLRTNASPLVRIEANYAIWQIDDSDTRWDLELLQEFGQTAGDARYVAGNHLIGNIASMNLSAAATVPVLLTALQDKDPLRQMQAARLLLPFKADALPALPQLTTALRHPHRDLRLAAAQAIQAIGPAASNAIPALVEALQDPMAQTIVARTLGAFGPAAAPAIPKLVEHLADLTPFPGSTELRSSAAFTLGRIGKIEDSVLAVLRKTAGDTDLVVCEASQTALREILSAPEGRNIYSNEYKESKAP